MIKTRPRCPVCGSRLNEEAIDRQFHLGDSYDVIEQDIGGRGNVGTVGSYDFDDEYAKVFLDKVEKAREYLRGILGIEDEEDEEEDD